jgi:hypothetical protein
LERAGGDPNAALAALIDAGLVEVRDLDVESVSDELFGRAQVRQDIANYENIIRVFSGTPSGKEEVARQRRLVEQARKDLADPKKLAKRGREAREVAKDLKTLWSDKPTKRTKAAAWKHAKLGRFTHDGAAWIAKVPAAGFDAFTYDVARRAKGRKYELQFEADEETDTPTKEAVAIAQRVIAKAKPLAGKVAKAMWDSFNGRGPKGMWWHGNLDDVATAMEDTGEDLAPPQRVEDLYRLMQLTNITVHKPKKRGATPLVELSFAAPFEEEHGVGVLTDGEKIVGIGYTADVRPFRTR